ncbi:MAG TPA: hypothetical protein VF418_05990 [Sphingomonadaceae bacterium]
MARLTSKFAFLAAGAAALSLAATPAQARGWHHHDGISFGDVVAGGLIIGGIAAIATAANSSKHHDTDRYDGPPPERYDDDYRAPPPRYQDGYAAPARNYRTGGINDAVSGCVDQVERGNDRVAAVDNATRTADGWHVSGQLSQGGGFNCSVDSDGRVRQLDFGHGRYSYNDAQPQDGQWSDDAYASAREQADASDAYDAPEAEPAYSD